jgi:Acyl-CoA thioesterase C-terminal domain/Acyl-CoA thioesterase N-terminal domain
MTTGMPRMLQAPYIVDANRVIPGEHALGPWFGDQQHGASLLGLLTRFMEQVPSYQPMRFTRVVADLSKAVPLAPFTVEARARRDGKRVQSLEAEVVMDGEVMASAVATRIRTEPGLVPPSIPRPVHDDAAPPVPDRVLDFTMSGVSFHKCLEVRSTDDRHDGDVTWYRLLASLVEGEDPSQAVRVASVADMVVGPAPYLGDGWVSINPEVTFQLEREPVGQWIGVESSIRFTDDGIGTSEAVIYDSERRIGRSAKSTLNFRR